MWLEFELAYYDVVNTQFSPSWAIDKFVGGLGFMTSTFIGIFCHDPPEKLAQVRSLKPLQMLHSAMTGNDETIRKPNLL